MKYLLVFCIATLGVAGRMPEPYRSVHPLPALNHGWYINSEQMTQLFAEKDIRIAVEVGSWLGKSSMHIASMLPAGGKLYCVDHWLGSPEHQERKKGLLPTLYQQFLSNVIHARLTDKIVPMRMLSVEAAAALNIKPDLVYIDASHDTESVLEDLEAWHPLVKGHGILCGDDWRWKSVRRAVAKFAADHGYDIEATDNMWILREKL